MGPAYGKGRICSVRRGCADRKCLRSLGGRRSSGGGAGGADLQAAPGGQRAAGGPNIRFASGRDKQSEGGRARSETDGLAPPGLDRGDRGFGGQGNQTAGPDPGRLQKVIPPLGKYAVLGNHEFYAGVEWSVDFMERANFTVLRNRAAMPSPWLAVVGIDDPTGSERGGEPPPRARPMLSRIDEDRLVILLTHRPELEEGAPGSFDIQLSGHTHGGQIFPFGLLVSRVFPYFKGRYDAGNGSVLYVNRGAGTWGPPVRILSPPEITLIRFVRPNQ